MSLTLCRRKQLQAVMRNAEQQYHVLGQFWSIVLINSSDQPVLIWMVGWTVFSPSLASLQCTNGMFVCFNIMCKLTFNTRHDVCHVHVWRESKETVTTHEDEDPDSHVEKLLFDQGHTLPHAAQVMSGYLAPGTRLLIKHPLGQVRGSRKIRKKTEDPFVPVAGGGFYLGLDCWNPQLPVESLCDCNHRRAVVHHATVQEHKMAFLIVT